MAQQNPADSHGEQGQPAPFPEDRNEPAGAYYQHPPPAPPPMYPPPSDPLGGMFRTIKAMLWSTAFISFLIVLILSFIIVLAMTPEIQGWITTPSVPSSNDPSVLGLPSEYIFIILPFPVLLFSISGMEFRVWHILMLSILTGAFAFGNYGLWKDWLSGKGRILLSLTAPEKANSSLMGVAKLFMATSFFSVVYFVLLSLGNVTMNTPPFDQLSRPELIYGLFNASVFEELVARVLLLGVPLALIAAIKQWKKPLKKLLGGGFEINHMTLGFITFSAVFFALAHAPGWDLWKVPQVLVTGFALGYAFVRYGLHASILIHFSINLGSSAMDIWPDNAAVGGLLGISYFIWIVIGSYFFFDYIRRLLKKLGIIQKPWPVQQAYPPAYPRAPAQYPPAYSPAYPPPYPPPQYQNNNTQQAGQSPEQQNAQQPRYNTRSQEPPEGLTTPGGFVCPNCGHTGAVYSGGKLTCMRCGSTFGEEKTIGPEDPDKEMFEF